MDAAVATLAFDWSDRAALTLARAAWVARCARCMAELAADLGLEQARAVAEALADDVMLRALEPEAAAIRIVRGR